MADYGATQLPSESFDVVWALENACYAPNKRSLLDEFWRLLRPGGRLVIADGFLTRTTLTPQERQLVERWMSGWAVPNVAGIDEFATWLREAGFRNPDFQDITAHVIPSSRRIYLASVLFYPLGRLLQGIGWRTAMQTRGIASGLHQYRVRRCGLGVYGLFCAVK